MSVPVHPQRPRVALACGCVLGEGPIWDERTGTLHFVDIESRLVLSWRPGSAAADRHAMPEKVGFVLPMADPRLVLVGLKSGLARLSLATGALEVVLRPEPGMPHNRLNDASVGPDGSVYLGTMNDAEAEATGSFYRWSETGLSRFGERATVTNGPAVDPGRRVLYAADTSAGVVYRHALDPGGAPGTREVFVSFGAGEGHPDGLTVDAEGHLWVCHFGGARVTRFTPDGDPALVVPMPTAQVTKLAFGGPDLSTAYVTTAARGRDRETDPLAGHLLAFETGARGLPTALARMGLP